MTIYTKSARFDTGYALSEDEMRKIAPSIFAVERHHSRSERFSPIPTIEVLRDLAKEGWGVAGVQESRARDADKQAHTKHLVRLRRFADGAKYNVGDSVVECLLKNANDGSSVYALLAGLFRVCCLNSLVAQKDTLEDIRVRHSGDVSAKVIEASYTVLGRAEKVMDAPVTWSKLALDRPTREAFAEATWQLRFPADPETGKRTTAIKPEQFLIPRREQDQKHDLWTVMNVIQENALRGGIEGQYRRENGRQGHRMMRAVNGIDQSVNLNRAIWTMADTLAEAIA